MAPESTKTKRKSSDKKVQFTDEASTRPTKKAKTTPKAEEPAEKTPAAKARENRKRAADFFEETTENTAAKEGEPKPVKAKKVKIAKEEVVVPPTKAKKSSKDVEDKPVKAKKTKAVPEEAVPTSISKTNAKEVNGKKKSKALVKTNVEEPAFDGVSSSDEDEINIADQTAALLAGFDSSSEESDQEGALALDQVPEAKISKKERKALAAAQNDKPGTIYVGRVPHGFFEHQMRAYFTQFGTVLRLRLSRNKKTGASKHYAFIEFESSEVADIVAKTMNNYLMFGHILKVRRVPDEQVHPDLWKGAGKRFKVIPRARMQARQLALPKGREYWRMKVEQEEEKRKEKAEKLKEFGYVFDMPAVKRVDDVPMKDAVDEAVKAITEVAAAPEDPVEKEIFKVVESVVEKKKDGKATISVTETATEKVKVKKSRKKAAKVAA